MRAMTQLARWCFALCAAGSLAVQAADGDISTTFKVRGGLQVSSPQDGLTNKLLGFGLEVGYHAHGGMWVAELGYHYKPGYQYRTDGAALAADKDATVDVAGSLESRKNKVDGISLRLGFEAPLTRELSWRAGIQLGASKFSHQVLGQAVGTKAGKAYTEAYYGVPTKNSLLPSPYAGLTWQLDKSSAVEAGLLLHSFQAIDYKHVAGAGTSKDYLSTQGRMLPHLEVAYVFRF